MEEDEEVKLKDWRSWLLPFLPLLLAVAFWLIFRGRLGARGIDIADMIFIGIVSAYALVRLPEQALFNSSPKFIAANLHDTCIGKWDTVGNFAIIRRGIDAFGLKVQLKSPVYICPIDALVKKGDSLIASALMSIKTIEEVPPMTQEFIIQNGLKPPYYVGYADVEQYMEAVEDRERVTGIARPTVAYLVVQIDELSKQVNMLKRLLKETYGVSEETLAAKMRMMDRVRGEPSLLAKIGKWVGARKEEKEE